MSATDNPEFVKQMCRTTRFIKNSTTLEPKCQICGKKGFFRHSFGDLYKVQIFCSKCRSNLPKEGFIDGVPILDAIDYIKKDSAVLDRYIKITKSDLDLIDKIFTLNLPRGTSLNELNISQTKFKRILDLYEIERDKDIRAKLDLHFRKVVKDKITIYKVKEAMNKNTRKNRLSEIQLEKGLSYRDIIKKSNEELSYSTLSTIANDKIRPRPTTFCRLAEVLGVSVADIYPEFYLYKEVFNFIDFKDLQRRYRNRLKDLKLKESQMNKTSFIFNLETELNFSHGRLYSFLSGCDISHSDLEKLDKFLNSMYI